MVIERVLENGMEEGIGIETKIRRKDGIGKRIGKLTKWKEKEREVVPDVKEIER